MTNSLFAASAADLTIERIRALAARPDQVESLTLEFKREYSFGLVKTIAAMANTYGGMILVGINDKAEPGVERVVGVDAQETIDKIASTCRAWPRPGRPDSTDRRRAGREGIGSCCPSRRCCCAATPRGRPR
ncbi:helix-turn-helix domain-containing protein [Streptomyces sp. NPDC058424]|uniref:AlbA family DNA-binding domain-containing protein n=1 Tax=Streptomyces sp. NPDC058424 TaxID=3346491 RepID=UPI0036491E7C